MVTYNNLTLTYNAFDNYNIEYNIDELIIYNILKLNEQYNKEFIISQNNIDYIKTNLLDILNINDLTYKEKFINNYKEKTIKEFMENPSIDFIIKIYNALNIAKKEFLSYKTLLQKQGSDKDLSEEEISNRICEIALKYIKE